MMATVPGPSRAEEQKWEAEDAIRTLTRADEIKKDGPLMRRVRNLAKIKAAEMGRIAGKQK